MNLSTWLSNIESLHPQDIDLGLERIKQVAERLHVLAFSCPVILVGGTNGKGSTVYTLEAIYRAAGAKTGAFTSPYLFKPNEQVRVAGAMASDTELCAAFARVEKARKDTPLTAFEFFTLAALVIFKSQTLDVLILEVGLGGRLDAVNILDGDVSVVTSISIDHVNWLGDTREKIGYEKAGIFRQDKSAVCGDPHPPASLSNPILYTQGQDFFYEENGMRWSWFYKNVSYENLPKNALLLQNLSTVLMTVTLLQEKLPVSTPEIANGLLTVHVPGRMQIVEGEIIEIYDVAHNPASVLVLNEQLKKMCGKGKTRAVFSMLADKDMSGSLAGIKNEIDEWLVAPLGVKRAASVEDLKTAFDEAGIGQVLFYATVNEAYAAAKEKSEDGDTVVVFGSFHTVAAVLTNP